MCFLLYLTTRNAHKRCTDAGVVLNASSVTFFLNIYTAGTREEEKRVEEQAP